MDVIAQRPNRPRSENTTGPCAHCQIALSDSEAWNFGTMELFVLALVAGSLVVSCGSVAATPGEIQAVLRYVSMFRNWFGRTSLPYPAYESPV